VGFVERVSAGVSPYHPNPSQAKVLALPAGKSASVIGAPGSGKTATLIALIAQRTAGGLSPDSILVLTPQRRAATRLRDQIAQRLGVATNGSLARTPGSLAYALALEHALVTGAPTPTLLTGSEQDAIIADLLAGHLEDGTGPAWPDPLVPEVRERRAFRAELRDVMSRATELGWGPAELAAASATHPEWKAVSEFWREYIEVLSNFRLSAYDSSELLALAATALANPDVMPQIKLVLVDDAGEITAGAVRMLRAFAARGIPIIAFGDPDTATTTFRGAQPAFLGRFEAELGLAPGASSQIILNQVHRHGPAVRSLVSAFTRMGTAEAGMQRQAASCVADWDGSPLISVLERASATAEATAIARLLRERHVRDGIAFSQMAVVVRNGAQVPRVARALAVAEVPTRTLVSERTIREHPAALDLLTLLQVALGVTQLDSVLANQLMLSPVAGLSVLELRRLRQALRHAELAQGGTRTGEELLLVALQSPGDFLTLDFRPAKRAGAFAQTLQQLRAEATAGASIEELLWTAWDRSGLATTWGNEALGSGLVADDANRNLDGVMALFTSAKRYVERFPERSPREFIEQMLSADVPEDTLAPAAQKDSVIVCTPTSLIGAEYDVVVVASVQENVWPNLRPRGSLLHAQDLGSHAAQLNAEAQRAADRAAVLDDELRMFTLALSRARQQVILSASNTDDTLPSPFLGRATKYASEVIEPDAVLEGVREHPMTLRGMVGSLRRALTESLAHGTDRAPELATALAKLAAAEVPGARTSQWYGLRELSTERPLVDPDEPISVSPSRLETWEKNQLAWFIDSVVGRTTGVAQGVGTIVHSVVELAGKNPELPIDTDSLFAEVDKRWHELSFEAEWLSASQRTKVREMMAAVSQYLTEFRADGSTLLASEGGFVLDVGKAQVRGYIDRIEQLPSGQVVIVDFKTGKKRPATKDVPEHAQLACYQLALSSGALKDADGNVIPGSTANGGAKLIYVTDGVRGKLYRPIDQEPFNSDQFDALRTRIEQAAEGMATPHFTVEVAIKEDKNDPYLRYEYRIHTVPAVSAS
jgi:superfamily I DNA/RNA helicase/RecB family exonuclease